MECMDSLSTVYQECFSTSWSPRRGSRRMAERINKQDWYLVDISKESLHFNAETTSAGGRAGLGLFFAC